MLYAGTERGVVFSADDGKTWEPLQLNLPTVPVHDLIVKNDDLVAGHARPIALDLRRPDADPDVRPLDRGQGRSTCSPRFRPPAGATMAPSAPSRRRTIRPPASCFISG